MPRMLQTTGPNASEARRVWGGPPPPRLRRAPPKLREGEALKTATESSPMLLNSGASESERWQVVGWPREMQPSSRLMQNTGARERALAKSWGWGPTTN
jgi:hypothetical protein